MGIVDQPQGSHLDAWRSHYARRASGMVASEVRALFAVASRPEIVSLAGGMPNVSALPLDAMAELVAQLVGRDGARALQYGSAQGDPALREAICEVMALEGVRGRPDDVVVTVGSQQALDLIARIFIDPGDVVVTEGPTYVTAIGTFAAYQSEIVHVPMDPDGVDPQALRETLARLAAAGRTVKLFYTVPTFQNPTGVTLAPHRRLEVLEICREAGVLVVEDNPYGLLNYDAAPMTALRGLSEPDGVLYLGTFSKSLAPGLRVGWVLAPPAVRDRLVLAAESAMLSHSAFAQMLVERYLRTQPWADQVKVFREMYRERRDVMLATLTASMPEAVSWTTPEGGFFVWLTLPDGVDAKEMLPRAIAARVAYVPGTGFFADGNGHQHMRLSYCFPPPDQIAEGVRRLAGVVEAEVELRNVFRPDHDRRG
jgi:DNA-binding transcriptional MocR family regulator